VTKALDAETETKTEAVASETDAKTEAVYLKTEAEAQGSWPIVLPHDAHSASAVLLSCVVRPSVCLSVTLMYRGHIGWTSSKLITGIISLGSSLLGATTSAT